MKSISRLVPVPLREIWKHEALDFSRWLAENLDYLEEVINLSLAPIELEAAAGDFAADILAEDPNGRLVVIENQLEKTDHEHLGKLLTYMSNLNAQTAIWITSQPRPEHKKAIDWLNETLPADMALYLIQVEAYRIANSPPALKFTVVAGPSEESRRLSSQKRNLSEQRRVYLEFWQGLLEKVKQRTSLHAHIKPSTGHWISTGAGKNGLTYAYVILQNASRIELYIDTQDQTTNKQYFDQLYAHKDAIEQAFGAALDWQRLDHRRASRIAYHIQGKGGIRDKERWHELQQAMIDAMIRLERAFRPYVAGLH